MPHQFDYLIIGSGIAGLSYATKLARYYDELPGIYIPDAIRMKANASRQRISN